MGEPFPEIAIVFVQQSWTRDLRERHRRLKDASDELGAGFNVLSTFPSLGRKILSFILFSVEGIVGVHGNNSMPITGISPLHVRMTQQGQDNRTISGKACLVLPCTTVF